MKSSSLYNLDPFIDNDGVLRVGGRLRQAKQLFEEKHPAILPRNSHLANLAIDHYHEAVHHQGRQISHGKIRQEGIWIIGANRMISKRIKQCVTCQRLRGKLLTQHMANLPCERSETPPPFTNVGFDVFGPWTIQVRKLRGGAVNAKRWGLIFTCLNLERCAYRWRQRRQVHLSAPFEDSSLYAVHHPFYDATEVLISLEENPS